MFDKLDAAVSRFEELESRLSMPGLYDDPAAAASCSANAATWNPS